MIGSVELENWRCADSLIVPLEPLTALVGPNGAGKTAVIDAIDLVLGSRWPSMAYVHMPRDFHDLNTAAGFRIRCNLDPYIVQTDAMKNEHEVASIEFRCQPYKRRTAKAEAGDLHDELLPLGPDGERPMGATTPPRKGAQPQFGPMKMTNGIREQARVLTISDRRSVASHVSGRRGSALSLLLDRARKDFEKDVGGARGNFKDRYEEALDVLRTDSVQEVEATISDTAKQMLGFLGSSAVTNLDISFGFADPSNPFSGLSVLCKQDNLILPAESMGLGIQSAIVIGVFEALRKQQANIGTLLIEEPEMYLHPQAQRFFHQLLVDMVDAQQCQVIFSTHSPIFADMTRFASVRLFQKPAGRPTRVRWIDKSVDKVFLQDQVDRQKLANYMDPASSEALFARRVLLVEGYADYLACRAVAKLIDVDLDAEGLSIVSCGGKNAIPFFARMCRALVIPTVVLHDTDIYEDDGTLAQWKKDENAKAPAQNEAIRSAVSDDSKIFTVEPTLEAAFGIGHNASDKPMKVAEAVDAGAIEDLPQGLVEAVRALVG